jgi:putative transposase
MRIFSSVVYLLPFIGLVPFWSQTNSLPGPIWRGHVTSRGLLHHSDRGVQYVCADYVAALAAAGIERSMSRAGNCDDNAAMESFWSTLKLDTEIDSRVPATRRAAELVIFDYLETFYNPTRRHSSLGYLSPVAFEKLHQQNIKKAA